MLFDQCVIPPRNDQTITRAGTNGGARRGQESVSVSKTTFTLFGLNVYLFILGSEDSLTLFFVKRNRDP